MRFKIVTAILVSLLPTLLFAQGIFIAGSVSTPDIDRVIELADLIHVGTKCKRIDLQHITGAKYKCRFASVAWPDSLRYWLTTLSKVDFPLPTEGVLNTGLVKVRAFNKGKRTIKLYDNSGVFLKDSANVFHSWSDVRQYGGAMKRNQADFLLNFVPQEFVLKCETRDGQDFSSADQVIQGTCTSIVGEIRSIQLRLNGGSWQTVQGTQIWHHKITLAEGANHLDIRACGFIGPCSTTLSITMNHMKQPKGISSPTVFGVTFVHPESGDEHNMVRNCISDRENTFQILWKSDQPTKNLEMVLIDKDNGRTKINLDSLERQGKVTMKMDTSCLLLPPKAVFGDATECIEPLDNWKLYFQIKGTDRKSKEITIRFQTFKKLGLEECECRKN